MCGLAGLIDWSGATAPEARERAVQAMNDRLRHRGPDDEGLWSDDVATLGQRRLSILDLSPAGHQPMASACDRYVITYNGEIYNHRDLIADLEDTGVTFRGHSDTEILVEACARWGVEWTLDRVAGMFAFALWDREQRTLVLARDRLGKKPLYWTSAGGRLAFASELTALTLLPATPRRIDRDALCLYLRHASVPAPRTILEGVHKLEPGTTLTFRAHDQAVARCYWSVRQIAAAGAEDPYTGTTADALVELDGLIDRAVAERLIADVPVGVFVSGGIDSSLVAARMARAASSPVRSFTIAFDDGPWNEGPYARAVCEHLGTDHTEFTLPSSAVLEHVDAVSGIFDEPFADASGIPTHLVSRLAREHVTVALAGDGGDELFAGYSRYPWILDAEARFRRWPRPLRAMAANVLGVVPLSGALGTKVHHYAGLIDARGTDDLYRRVVSAWRQPLWGIAEGREPRGLVWDHSMERDIPDPLARMQAMDAATFLSDDILTKVDRASMAVSLEVRTPMLDHRIAEFAFRLPRWMLLDEGRGKLPLRTLLAEDVPPELTERPKQGFSPPVGDWLRGPLRDWAGDLLASSRLDDSGLLNSRAVQALWRQHESGGWHHANALWAVVMFERWRETHLDTDPLPEAMAA
ncbi:MAG: asparagine synthase (glutamine-hydrolyzing) [Rhodospirillaceae bacterium]|nr:asparagine synthase (glutamine-hydrolyzing) [Rhodospirillaceae bacterium]|tara:strand:+ start:3344 stop:5260 length:1917 start_codon:yes stop_codon:yes gene_type:complete